MKNNRESVNIPAPGQKLLKYAAMYIWLILLFVAMANSYFLEALSAMVLSLVLVYVYLRKQKDRTTYFKRIRKQSEKCYHVNEDYLRIFSAEK